MLLLNFFLYYILSSVLLNIAYIPTIHHVYEFEIGQLNDPKEETFF